MSGKIPFLTKGPMALFFGGKYRLSDPWGAPTMRRRGCTLLVFEIGVDPPAADFGSIWSTQKVQKFQHIKQTTKLRIL